jgi:hypothetical protein
MSPQAKKTAEVTSPLERKFPSPGKTLRRPASRRTRRKGNQPVLTIWEKLRRWSGQCKGLPPDLAERHDFYLYGRKDV